MTPVELRKGGTSADYFGTGSSAGDKRLMELVTIFNVQGIPWYLGVEFLPLSDVGLSEPNAQSSEIIIVGKIAASSFT